MNSCWQKAVMTGAIRIEVVNFCMLDYFLRLMSINSALEELRVRWFTIIQRPEKELLKRFWKWLVKWKEELNVICIKEIVHVRRGTESTDRSSVTWWRVKDREQKLGVAISNVEEYKEDTLFSLFGLSAKLAICFAFGFSLLLFVCFSCQWSFSHKVWTDLREIFIICFGRRVCRLSVGLSVPSVPRQISEITRDTREISSPL